MGEDVKQRGVVEDSRGQSWRKRCLAQAFTQRFEVGIKGLEGYITWLRCPGLSAP